MRRRLGLYHDVSRNVARCRDVLEELRRRRRGDPVSARLDALDDALAGAPKSRRWRLRAALGERLAWHEPVDDAEGVFFAPSERP